MKKLKVFDRVKFYTRSGNIKKGTIVNIRRSLYTIAPDEGPEHYFLHGSSIKCKLVKKSAKKPAKDTLTLPNVSKVQSWINTGSSDFYLFGFKVGPGDSLHTTDKGEVILVPKKEKLKVESEVKWETWQEDGPIYPIFVVPTPDILTQVLGKRTKITIEEL